MKNKTAINVIIIIILIIGLFYFIPFKTTNNDEYKSFEELAASEIENEDYTIHIEETDSNILLMAIHGGGIEPGTTELVKYIATKNNYAYYSFNGIKKQGNQKMHITSTNYEEPQALELVAKSVITLSFHGYNQEEKKHTYIGGLDKELAKKIKVSLKEAGFSVSDSPKRFKGIKKANIVNKNQQKKGVQLELSTAQRMAFFKDNNLASKNRKQKETEFYKYTEAIENGLEN